MQSFEIEIKSLLGHPEKAEELRSNMKRVDPETKLVSKNKQLNHYFIVGKLERLHEVLQDYVSDKALSKLSDVMRLVKDFSVRTREKDGEVLIVIKASVDDGTSSNGVARIEIEEPVKISLEKLDDLVLSAGFSYQAKWSREREEYDCKKTRVCIDRNAGYGYLAEFEQVISDQSLIPEVRKEIESLMKELGVEELPQDRLERMFAHYNSHWGEYYGTNKIFTVL